MVDILPWGGGNGTGNFDIRVYSFDGSYLTEIEGANKDHGNFVESVHWSPDGRYLAMGGYGGTGGYEIRAYSFDGSSLTEIEDANKNYSAAVKSVNWSPDGRYLAVGGQNGTVRVYAAMDAPTNCILQGNVTSNSHGYPIEGRPTIGYGIAAGGENLFIANIGYSNDANFSYGVMPMVAGARSNPGVMDNLWLPGRFAN